MRSPRFFFVLVLVALLCTSVAHGQAQPEFAAPEYLLTGHGIIAVEAADIDTDGDSDLVALFSEGEILVFHNDGAGGFGPMETLTAPGSHLDMAVADLNGDGAPDVAVANFGDGTVSVMLNSGAGQFGPPMPFDAPGVSVCRGLAVGDLDGDGDADLLVGDPFNSDKSVLLNNGAGIFDQALPFDDGGTCIAIAMADLDDDGDRDAVTVFNGVWVHCNNGDGTFAPAMTLATGSGYTSVAIADLDHDGHDDIAVSRSTSGEGNYARVFLNNGEGCGAFTHIDYPISTLSRDIALDDLNGDAFIDMATSHVSSVNRVSVLVNHGDGTFASAVEFFPGEYPQSLTIADLDADGRNDIATANQFHNPRTIGLLINITPSFVAGDFTGDGAVDEEDRAVFCSALGSSSGEPAYITAADLNGDGVIDELDQQMFNNLLPPCAGDIVTGATFQPPADGVTGGADLAFLLGAWASGPSCADFVTSASFAPPPDGVVDGADLAYLLGAWGLCTR